MSKSPKKRKRIEISDDEEEPAEEPTPGQKRIDSSSDEENQCQNTPKIKRDRKRGISCTSGQGGSGQRRSGSSVKSPVKFPTPSSTRAKKMVMFQGTYYSDDYYGDKEDALDAEEAEEMDDFIVNDEEESAGEEGDTSDEEQYEEQSESDDDDEIEEVPKTGTGCSKKIIAIDEDENEEEKQIKIGKGKNKGKQKGKGTIQNHEENLPVRRSRRIQRNAAQKELNEDKLRGKIKGRRQKVKAHPVDEGNEEDDDEEEEELADEEEDEEEDEGEIIHETQDRTAKNKDNSPVRRSQRIRGKAVERELNDEWFRGKLVERRQKAIPVEEENDEEDLDLDDEEEEIVYDEEEDEVEPTELPIRQALTSKAEINKLARDGHWTFPAEICMRVVGFEEDLKASEQGYPRHLNLRFFKAHLENDHGNTLELQAWWDQQQRIQDSLKLNARYIFKNCQVFAIARCRLDYNEGTEPFVLSFGPMSEFEECKLVKEIVPEKLPWYEKKQQMTDLAEHLREM